MLRWHRKLVQTLDTESPLGGSSYLLTQEQLHLQPDYNQNNEGTSGAYQWVICYKYSEKHLIKRHHEPPSISLYKIPQPVDGRDDGHREVGQSLHEAAIPAPNVAPNPQTPNIPQDSKVDWS